MTTALRTQDAPGGGYRLHPHLAEPYPKGHASHSSCVRCGRRLDNPIHRTMAVAEEVMSEVRDYVVGTKPRAVQRMEAARSLEWQASS
jgi:hypothetical protein